MKKKSGSIEDYYLRNQLLKEAASREINEYLMERLKSLTAEAKKLQYVVDEKLREAAQLKRLIIKHG